MAKDCVADMSAVKLTNVSFDYQMQSALKDINISVEKGEKVALMGLNGSGKSTLLKLIVGLLMVKEGTCEIMGRSLSKKNVKAIQKIVGYVFQNADEQLFMPTVYEDLAFGIRHEQGMAMRVDAMLQMLGITHLKDKAPFQLSGGEKRAVAIGTVLIMSPELILMDEPTEGLDAKMKRKLIKLLNQRNETFIISTHDENLVKKTCDHVILLSEGRMIGKYETESFFQNTPLLKLYELIE